MKRLIINDFSALMYCFNFFVNSEKVKTKLYDEIDIFIKRLYKNLDYFKKNNAIVAFFNYFQKLVDFFRCNTYTI